jgi:putative MATE family efflux protein
MQNAPSKNKTKLDMTHGPIMKLVVLFAIPMVIGNILQQLYTTVDTLVIGNYCGHTSIAAIGTSSQPLEVFMCVFMGIGSGVSILVSVYTGAKNTEKLNSVVRGAVAFTYLAAIPLTILGILLTPAILRMMQVPADTWDLAVLYIRIVFLGLLGNMGYNMNAGILRGLGDSTASLVFLVVSCITNIVLDFLFVAGFHMDVAGAALSTVIAMYLSWFASIIYLLKKYPYIPFTILPRTASLDIMKEIMSMGLPLGLNNSLYTVGHIILQSLINTQGSEFMAGASVAGKIMGVGSVATASFSAAMSTFAGQNYGARDYIRLRQGARRVPVFSAMITITLGIIMYTAGPYMVHWFTDDPLTMEYALLFMHIQIPFQWCFGVLNCVLNLANGIGAVRFSTVVNLLMLWAVRIPSAYLISRFINGHYVNAGVSISFTFGMIASLFFFRSKHWKEVKRLAVIQEQDSQKGVTDEYEKRQMGIL